MATASFTLSTKQWVTVINKLRDRGPIVASRAINKSAASAKTAMVKVVREDLGLRAKDVRDSIVLIPSRPTRNPEAKLRASRKRIPLIVFGARQLKRGGVRTRMKGGTNPIPGAFIATMKSGHTGVFKRKTYPGGPRLPIVELKGASVAKVFVKHWRTGARRFREQLPKNLASEIRFAARGR